MDNPLPPLAHKLIRNTIQYARPKLVNLREASEGLKIARELEEGLIDEDSLAALPPGLAAYMYTQNRLSVLTEQVSALSLFAPLTDVIDEAMDEFMPGGPPMSPLTDSYFFCWATFDLHSGEARETLGTLILALGEAVGMHPRLLELGRTMQESRMGVYEHLGMDGDSILFRDLLTGQHCCAHCASGYNGRKGQLWYVRLLPPPFPDSRQWVVFTTPYVLRAPDKKGWLACIERALVLRSGQKRLEAGEEYFKYGPTSNYWNEFVSEAYAGTASDDNSAIFLTGLPDQPESRPFSRVNS